MDGEGEAPFLFSFFPHLLREAASPLMCVIPNFIYSFLKRDGTRATTGDRKMEWMEWKRAGLRARFSSRALSRLSLPSPTPAGHLPPRSAGPALH